MTIAFHHWSSGSITSARFLSTDLPRISSSSLPAGADGLSFACFVRFESARSLLGEGSYPFG